jgi:hypothetical protein
MGWESRRGQGRYYTRSRKVDGRVVREYIGTGLVGELAALVDAEDRAQRRAERERLEMAMSTLAAPDAALAELSRVSDALATMHLLAAGYRRHHRGEWRKRRATPT